MIRRHVRLTFSLEFSQRASRNDKTYLASRSEDKDEDEDISLIIRVDKDNGSTPEFNFRIKYCEY